MRSSEDEDRSDYESDPFMHRIDELLLKDKELEKLRIKTGNSGLQKQPVFTELVNAPSTAQSIDNAILCNNNCKQVLQLIERRLEERLKENRKKQKELNEYITLNKKGEDDDLANNLKMKCAGIPYFKDKRGFKAPLNDDVKKKLANHEPLPEYFFTTVGSWTARDHKILEHKVVEFVRNSRIEKLKLKQEDAINENPDNEKEIEVINNEIEDLKNKPSHLLNIDSKEVDWLNISKQMEKYSDHECEAKWTLELDPRINKSKWKPDEIRELEKIAKKYEYQDWDLIAKKLNTNRSGYQCCVKYHSKNNSKEGKWTSEEDEKLKEMVEKHRVRNYIPWTKIAWHFDSRSVRQCRERYVYCLNVTKKGVFNDEENYKIVTNLKKHQNQFPEIAKHVPGRSVKQIRSRYDYMIGMAMKPFSDDEETKLIKLVHQFSTNWNEISKEFKERTALQCRKAWEKLKGRVSSKELFENTSSDDFDTEEVNLKLPPTNELVFNKKINKKNLRKSIEVAKNPLEPPLNEISTTSTEETTEDEIEDSVSYERLLEYLKTGHGFAFGPKPKIFNSPEEKIKSSSKMSMIMSMLGVSCDFSSKFETVDSIDSCEFTVEDRDILKQLREKKNDSVNLSAQLVYKNLIPPNFTTLNGLKSMILAKDVIRDFTGDFIPENTSVPNPILPGDRLLFSDAKSLFKNRLKSLFALPIICSLTDPETIPNLVTQKRKKPKALSRRKKKAHSQKMVKIVVENKKNESQQEEQNVDDLRSENDGQGNSTAADKIPMPPSRKRGRPKKTEAVKKVIMEKKVVERRTRTSVTK